MPGEIERLTVVLDARIDRMEKALAKANRAAYGSAARIQKSLDGVNANRATASLDRLANRVPVVGDLMGGMGVVTMTAAAAFGSMAFAVNRAMEAMNFGDELQAQADKLRISAEAMQELQFAAEETDVPVEDLAKGLENLNARLGAFRTGFGDAKIKGAFELLGISKDSLKDISDANQLIPILADKIRALQSTADQTRVAKALGVEELLPLLRQGSQGIQEMTDRAHELGLVLSNETVKALADADREMEVATRQIQTGLRAAFSGLAVDIAQAVTALAQFVNWMRNVERNAPALAAALNLISAGMPGSGAQGLLDRAQRPQSAAQQGLALGQKWLDRVGEIVAAQTAGPGPVLAGRGSSRSARSGEDEAKKRRDQARRIADMFAALDMEELNARAEAAKTAEERYDIARERSRAERAAYELDLERMVEDKELSAVQAEELLAARTAVDILEAANDANERNERVAEARADAAEAALEAEAELLQMAAALATTSAQRREIELRLLDIAFQQEEARLKALANDQTIEQATREQAQAALDALAAKKGLAAEGVRRGTESPLEQFQREAQITTDSLEELATRGLEQLNAGLVDAILNAENLGDVARNVFRQMAADLLAMMIRQNVTAPLAAMFKIPGFAGGTMNAPGGLAIVGEKGPELVNLPKGAQVIPSSATMKALRNGAGGAAGGSSMVVHQNITLQANGDQAIVRLVRSASRAAYAEAVNEAARRQPGVGLRHRLLEA